MQLFHSCASTALEDYADGRFADTTKPEAYAMWMERYTKCFTHTNSAVKSLEGDKGQPCGMTWSVVKAPE